MTHSTEREKNRRQLLKYLAASPVLGMGAKSAMAATGGELLQRPADPYVWKPFDPNFLIEKPEDALEVFEFEPIAHKNVPAAHFGFMSTGADDEGSYRANRQDISKFAIRSRRLRDVRKADPSMEIFGSKYAMPYFLCPIGSQAMHHPDGEMAVGRASGKYNVAQSLSTYASFSTTDVNKARGGAPVIFQLYPQSNFEITKSIVARAERDGCKAMVVTVDGTSNRKDLQFERSKRDDRRLCATCHDVRPGAPKSPMITPKTRAQFTEVPAALWEQKGDDAMTWEFMKRLRGVTKMDIFVKGIMDAEDATMCVKNGYGVYVSNHGGRNEDTSGSTIASLPDIVAAVKGKVPIFIDGCFRRGMDIVKAIAMGATMVGVGRPYLWGLGAFGEAGVDKVLQILNAEVLAAMQQVGAVSLKDLNPGMIHPAL